MLSRFVSRRIPFHYCYEEDTGLFCAYATLAEIRANVGNIICYVNDTWLAELVREDPTVFDADALHTATPDKRGLYYLPWLYK